MSVPGLNLFANPWIPVIHDDGTRAEVGVRTALTDAARIAAIDTGDPTVDVAVYRLLLALVHRLTGPVAPRDWPALWEAGLPLEGLEEIGRGQWELFPASGEPGFAQDPVEYLKATPVAAMTARADRGAAAGYLWSMPESLAPAEAARWLLWCHAYDTGGIRAAHIRGIDRGVPVGPAAAAPYTRLVADTLARTLLLNLAPGDRGPAGEGWWERTEPVAGRRRGRTPEGMVDLLCWPGRRIRLLADRDGLVRRVYVTGGDDLKEPGDPGHGGPQSTAGNLSYALLTPWALEATIPGLGVAAGRRASLATPEVIDWFADRHHVLGTGTVCVETTTLVMDKYKSIITDMGHRQWVLPCTALVPGSDAHSRLGRLQNMLFLTASAIRAAVEATVVGRDGAGRVGSDLALAREEWSGLVTPELAGLDSDEALRDIRRELAALAERYIGLAEGRLGRNAVRMMEAAPGFRKARGMRRELARYPVEQEEPAAAG